MIKKLITFILFIILVQSNYTTCMQGSFDYYDAAQKLKDDYKSKQFNLIVDDVDSILKEATDYLEACNQMKYAEQVQKLLPNKCVDSLATTTKLSNKIIHQDNKSRIADVPLLLASFVVNERTCPLLGKIFGKLDPVPDLNITLCVEGGKGLYDAILKIQNDYKAGAQFSVLAQDVENVVPKIQDYLTDCDLPKYADMVQTNLPAVCVHELQQSAIIAYDLATQQLKPVDQLLDLINLIGNLTHAKADCPFLKTKPTNLKIEY